MRRIGFCVLAVLLLTEPACGPQRAQLIMRPTRASPERTKPDPVTWPLCAVTVADSVYPARALLDGHTFELSLSSEESGPRSSGIVSVEAVPLEGEALRLALQRLPELEPMPDAQCTFARPVRSRPPPDKLIVKDVSFPPSPEKPEVVMVAPGDLKLLRFTPRGEVGISAQLSATFSHPMVPIAGALQGPGIPQPVRLAPQPPGKWRWLNAQTILFEPEHRFPMATEYEASVAAGTGGISGARLTAGERWAFRTPPPSLNTFWPRSGPQDVQPIFFLEFDQQVHPEKVLARLTLTGGERDWDLRLATEEEIAGHAKIPRLIESATAGTHLTVRSRESLPVATEFAFLVGPGIPSAEGPLTSSVPDTFQVRTYGPLEFVRCRCCGDEHCPAHGSWVMRFSNPLDSRLADHPEYVQIDPPVEELSLSVRGADLYIKVIAEVLTTYELELGERITDCFGQTLAEPVNVTLTTGLPPMRLSLGFQNFTILDPTGPAILPIRSEGCSQLKIIYYAVTPDDWALYRSWRGRNEEWPLEPMAQRVIDVADGGRKYCEIELDLEKLLEEAGGMLVVDVAGEQAGHHFNWTRQSAWIQRTPLALSAHSDGTKTLVWVTNLATGESIEGATVNIQRGSTHAVTDEAGIALLPKAPDTKRTEMLVARYQGQVAIFPDAYIYPYREPRDALVWHVLDDRRIYRPGERVHVKGWLRCLTQGPMGEIENVASRIDRILCSLEDAQGTQLHADTISVDCFGSFHLNFELPESANCGHAHLKLEVIGDPSLDNKTRKHSFRIEEFRRPEFEVKTRSGDAANLAGDGATISAEAHFYSGGGVSDAEVTWTLKSRPGHYRPPGWNRFTFCLWTPRWTVDQPRISPKNQFNTTEIHTGMTGAHGNHTLRLDVRSGPPIPMSVSAEASIMDYNRQAWASRTDLLIHPAAIYVGLRSEGYFVEQGDTLSLEAIVTDLDGEPLVGQPIAFAAEHYTGQRNKQTWEPIIDRCLTWSLTSADTTIGCRILLAEPGSWTITAQVIDDQGRLNLTQMTRWVAGDVRIDSPTQLRQEKVAIIPDQDEWSPGETARLLMRAPFYPAEALVTLRRQGFLETRRIRFNRPTYTLTLPIREEYVSGLQVQVDLVGSTARVDKEGQPITNLPPRPAYARGGHYLRISPFRRQLSVVVEPAALFLAPGELTPVTIRVCDAVGCPLPNAQVLLMAVDEAILGLTNYVLPDPILTFYGHRSSGIKDAYIQSHVRLARDLDFKRAAEREEDLQGRELHFRGGRASEVTYATVSDDIERAIMLQEGFASPSMVSEDVSAQDENVPINMRQDFNPLAHFAPTLVTDDDGQVIDTVRVPDNLSRYRLMAVAVDGERKFGHGESVLTTQLPLMVRPSPPRFLNLGDRAKLPVVVHNESDETCTVDVVVRSQNLTITGPVGQRVTVPAHRRAAVHFEAETVSPGTAGLLVGAMSGQRADAAYRQFPVWTPATTEAFAAYGVIDSGAVAHAVAFPQGALPEFGELEVTTASTAMYELSDAIASLSEYPHASTEVIASRLLGLVAVRDVIRALDVNSLANDPDFDRFVDRSIAELENRRTSDQGYAPWRRDQESWPFLTVHVAHALIRAHQAGCVVNRWKVDRTLGCLRHISTRTARYTSSTTRQTIEAYALYVRHLWDGRPHHKEAAEIVSSAGGAANLPLEVLGWLLPVLDGDDAEASALRAEILRQLEMRVMETAAHAEFTTIDEDQGYLIFRSRPRTDALLLVSLLEVAPDSDLIVKLVRGLLESRRSGCWSSSQENAWVLLALGNYFRNFEAEVPDFAARTWLGEEYFSERGFKGYSLERQRLSIPLRDLATYTDPQRLILGKEGTGRLYYRIGMRYALRDARQPAANCGFGITRKLTAVDDSSDVWRDEEGTWHIKAGARVRIELAMETTGRRYHIVLTDPLPAGFEPVNVRLVGTGSVPPKQKDDGVYRRSRRPWRGWRHWYEHQNLRDDRIEAFASRLNPGIYEYSYVARATATGRFIAPPCKAEEMYHPETFGRSATDIVVIED